MLNCNEEIYYSVLYNVANYRNFEFSVYFHGFISILNILTYLLRNFFEKDYFFELNEWLIMNSLFIALYYTNKFYIAFEEKLNRKIFQKIIAIELLFIIILRLYIL